MATLYWQGLASAVAQVSTVQITAYDAATTYKVTIGGVTVSTIAAGGVNATATALQSALSTSTHPYFTAINWTVATDTITGTAKVAGVPFIATSSKSGGTGTIGAVTTSTASSGPNDWSTAANWSTGSVPASGDTVIFSNNAVNVCWGLSTGVTGVTQIRVEQSYTGRIGLDYLTFATTSNGTSNDSSVMEYRQLYCAIGTSSLQIGIPSVSGSATGSGRLMFDLGSTTACTVDVFNTASASSDTYRSAVRLLANLNTTNVYVRSAPGGVGVCSEVPGETSTINKLKITDTSASTKVVTGNGITMSYFAAYGGNSIIKSDNTIPQAVVYGGTVTMEGSGDLTALTTYGGTTNNNMNGTTGATSINGGVVSCFGNAKLRTWTTITVLPGGTLQLDPLFIGWTSISLSERTTITCS